MADENQDGRDAQVTFKVKTSGDKSHTITMAETAKVVDLKTKLAGEDFENVPVERQRLIYSGRVMKNEDTLSTYKIKSGNTVHMVKSAPSNPTPAPTTTASAPTTPAVPHNMAAGTAANNLLAGLTGARFAGHAALPNRDIFGADGGMGAPPSEENIADMLSDPAMLQSMNEALNNPAVVDMIIQQNPALASMPNAREIIASPYFRSMMTNPEHIRMAARMRSAMGGGMSAFPAPGATDNTPADSPATGGTTNAAAGTPAANPFAAFGGVPGGNNPFAALFGDMGNASAPSTTANTGGGAAPASGAAPAGGNAVANPFAALFGGGPAANNPFAAVTPEMMQQAMALWGPMAGAAGAGAPATPPDNRPPEEKYASQLRQLNDMGFFDFDRNVVALNRSGGSVQGAIEQLLNGS